MYIFIRVLTDSTMNQKKRKEIERERKEKIDFK